MAKLYYRRIKNSDGEFTIEDVPKRWREEVMAMFESETREDGI